MNKESLHHQDILSEIELVNAWKSATGDSKNYDNLKKSDYLTANLFDGKGTSAKLELHPDFLNNQHRVVIEDFSAFEGDDDYLDGIQMVSHALQTLRDSGLSFTVSGLPEYSDGEQITSDVEAMLQPDKTETKDRAS